MDSAAQRALDRFVGDLARLRRLAGSPSLNQLVEHARDQPRPLRRSTLSDKLTAKSLPNWDFVVSFVAACRAYAERAGTPLPEPASIALALGALGAAGWARRRAAR